MKLKQIWHHIWGLKAYPCEIYPKKWWMYFRKDVREYLAATQAQLNSPDNLHMIEDALLDQIVFGSSTTEFNEDDWGECASFIRNEDA